MNSQVTQDYVKTNPKIRFNQGDILHDVRLVQHTGFVDGKAEIKEITLSYGVIVSQECDLEHDYDNRNNAQAISHDKYLPNILVIPAYLTEEFKDGKHLGKDVIGHSWSSKEMQKIKNNDMIRFHNLKSSANFQIPELILDFKHLYTVKTNVLYNDISQTYLATICELFREYLSQRYTNYLSRIGLPIIN